MLQLRLVPTLSRCSPVRHNYIDTMNTTQRSEILAHKRTSSVDSLELLEGSGGEFKFIFTQREGMQMNASRGAV